MIEFKDVELSDKEWVDEILSSYESPSLEYNFTTMFIWQKVFKIKIAKKDGFLFAMSGEDKKAFMFPAGKGDTKSAVDSIIEFSEAEGITPRFYSLSEEQKEFLEENYPKLFQFKEDRNAGDYIYERETLLYLKGKKLSSKRNHINSFEKSYPDWSYEKITRDNIKEVALLNEKWCENNSCKDEPGLLAESCAVRRAIKYFEELGLSGGLLRADKEAVAFSFGDRLNTDTFLVHIEKAYSDIRGAYPMINREFVKNACCGYKYVNREDDTGDEGLRKAKLSYQPFKILKKYYGETIK